MRPGAVLGLQRWESNQADNTTDLGDTVTASGSTHTKGSWTELIASTARDAFGIYVTLSEVSQNNQNTRMLVDVGIGTTVLLPDLNAGMADNWTVSGFPPINYYFPVYIPAASQIQARCQSNTASDTVVVHVRLVSDPLPGTWYGNRVTAYGVVAASSRGTEITNTNVTTTAFGDWTELTASTTNPIRYMQIGWSGADDSSISGGRKLMRVGVGAASSEVVVTPEIPSMWSGNEFTFSAWAPFLTMSLRYNLPAGTRLAGSHAGNSVNGFDMIVYGVD